jgi:hypothetical protein
MEVAPPLFGGERFSIAEADFPSGCVGLVYLSLTTMQCELATKYRCNGF